MFHGHILERATSIQVSDGGYALAAHGHPRYTKDLDVWVWNGAENASRDIADVADSPKAE
ncbi:MAG: hypothetical protein JHC59_01310 [Ilumatobacteraceae bacterium]|nr:hypothetical protein [Ilumatobacteraceae bacterium]